MDITDLEATGDLQLLLFLYPNKRAKISDINIKASRSTLYNVLETLSRLELIDEERVPPYTRYIKLTSDGQKMAEKVFEMEKIFQAKQSHKKSQNPP
ncbi:MAG: hypothetical protein ACQCN6_00080 [Candidatus Bathyarchaeia archaeon]|jgi:DNA-binding PadR family transcriptional regulator